MYTKRLEASVTRSIGIQLENLGWVIDEKNKKNNVTQQRAKTKEQKLLLKGKQPDFVLYEQETTKPIGIIEAKKPGESLEKALDQAENNYAKPLNASLIFAYNDTFIETRYLHNGRSLKIDGEDVRQFIDHYTALRFINEGSEIFSAPQLIQHSRDELIKIFKKTSNLLREAGLQAGLERFGTFSDILFLKILDEVCELNLYAGKETKIYDYLRWHNFIDKAPLELYDYLQNVVWKKINTEYQSIFSDTLPIQNPDILQEIIKELSKLKLLTTDTDIKGDAFEYFLKNAYQGLSIKDLGEYFTPRNIVRTMVSMVNPKIGEKIYDPFCGTGGFLIESFKYIKIRTKLTEEIEQILKIKTLYGTEITSNNRIAKMNMILFGDGHSNIQKKDTFANPQKEKYDIIVTNPPYSQKTRYGNLYSIDSSNGDVISILHCFDSLKKNGRAAILVKENFLSDKGDMQKVREYILKNSNNFSVISLPRKLFEPYTPTKTSIIYFEKRGTRNSVYFYVTKKVGHTLSARKKNISQNDLPKMLDAFNSQKESKFITSCIVDKNIIFNNNFSLWIYDYFELILSSKYKLDYLGNYIVEIDNKINPSDYPDKEFKILGVSNKVGIFENEMKYGYDIKQKYKQVKTNYLVYNPHRINVGSIGIVDINNNGGYVSNIYIVFKSINEKVPAEYILYLLKLKKYIKIIEAYDTKYGAVRANLTYEQLSKIKIPILPDELLHEFLIKQNEVRKVYKILKNKTLSINELVNEYFI